jgi:hypothetical protein
MADMDVAIIMRLVDQVSGPAKAVVGNLKAAQQTVIPVRSRPPNNPQGLCIARVVCFRQSRGLVWQPPGH